MGTYVIGGTVAAAAGAWLKWSVTRLPARPDAGHEGRQTVKRAAACAALTAFALAGCAGHYDHAPRRRSPGSSDDSGAARARLRRPP